MCGNDKKSESVTSVTIEALKEELDRVTYKKNFYASLKSTIGILITVAAIAVLISTLWLPLLKIYGSSMTPTLNDGELILSVKSSEFEIGDIISFYYNNKILIKRVIAKPGQWVDIDKDGNVYVDKVLLEEPYLEEKSLGECTIDLPYQVPDGKVFVMGDHRSISIDSRNKMLGCVAQEQIVGKIIGCIWPLERLGPVK